MVRVLDEKMGEDMNEESMTAWSAEVSCLDPCRKRNIWPIIAFSEEQAILIAVRKACEMFGKQGEGWISLTVHMQNST